MSVKTEIAEFMEYLNLQVKSHAIYVLGGQGEFVVDILPNLTSMESTDRVDQILTLISKNLKNYTEDGTFSMFTSRCFDCSGLGTYWFLLRKFITSDTTADGLYKQCKVISKSELVKGDMVFKKSKRDDGTYYMSHVGYYQGDDIVVESKGRAYGVVKTKLSEGSWSDFGRPKWWYSANTLYRKLKYIKDNLMRGDDVKLVQSKLALLGYSCGSIDGAYGPKTEQAVKNFQNDNGLTVDGIVGKKTCKALGLKWAG